MRLSGRKALLRLVAVLAALLAQAVPAAASPRPGDPCSHSTVSAADEYCENIPSATGGHQVTVGTPALAGQLPPSMVSAISGARASGATASSARAVPKRTRAGLLRLPARSPFSLPIPRAAAHPSGWSVASGLIAGLIGVTLAMSALALIMRRRRGTTA